MKKLILVLLVVIFVTPTSVFAQIEPIFELKSVPMITITGNPGDRFEIQYSMDLGVTDSWSAMEVVSTYDDPVFYCDISAVGHPRRFYRVVQLPPADALITTFYPNENRSELVAVDETNDTNGIRIYSIDLEAVGADVTIIDAVLLFEKGDTTTSGLTDMIKKVDMFLDNSNVYSKSFTGSVITFDNLGLLQINTGDVQTLNFEVDLNDRSGNYENGDSFLVSGVTINYIDQYGNTGVLSGLPQGGLKTLRSSGAIFEFVSSNVNSVDPAIAQYEIKFSLTSFEDTTYIPKDGGSVIYEVVNELDEVLNLPVVTNLTSNADQFDEYFKVLAGETESFTFHVVVDNSSQPTTQNVRVRLKNVGCRFGSTTAILDVAPLIVPSDTQTSLLVLEYKRPFD
jgi:hypothetical protein